MSELNFDAVGLMKIFSLFQSKKSIDDSSNDFEFHRLTDEEILTIFRSSTLIQKIIKKYPMESKTIGYQLIDSNGNIISDKDEENILLEAFKDASIFARMYAKSYLHLHMDDFISDDKPIKKGSKLKGYKIHFDLYREGDFYNIENEKVHYSRILIFFGNRTYAKNVIDIDDVNYSDSVLQGLYNAYNDYLETNVNAKYILKNLSYLSIGIDNLGAMSKSDEGRGLILDRLVSLNMNRSITRTIAFDKKTEAMSFISQTLTGVKDVIEELKEIFISESDYPVEEIFDQSPKQKLGSGIQNQLVARYLWARRCRLWAINNWLNQYMQFFTSTKNMENLKLDIPFKVDLTEEEKANIQLIGANRIKTLIDAGVIVDEEARTGYMGDEYSLNIELDNNAFMKKSKETKKEELQSMTLIENPPASNTDAIPDDKFWDALASVTMADIDAIGEEILSV
jgi:hypothetical protein